MTVLAIIALTLILVLLVCGWFYWTSEGGILGFFMAWNIMDTAGHVLTALIACIASMTSNDS